MVGLGAVGSAALFHATERGLRVLGIDRHHPPHEFGSSHAESRVTRLAVGEGPQYLPFVARSHEIWRDLEARTGETLLYQPGGYILCPNGPTEDERWGSFVPRTAAVASEAGIEYHLRTPAEVGAHLPNVMLRGDELVGFEPTGGIVLCERAIATQLELARRAGATTVLGQAVDTIRPHPEGVVVSAGSTEYRADRVIVCVGAWFPELAEAIDAAAVTVTRQVTYWFEVDEPEAWSADLFPFMLWAGHTIADYFGVFPIPPGGVPGIKVLTEQFHTATTAETVDRQVSQREVDDFYIHLVARRLRGVRPRVVKSSVCLYTNTVDDHFLVDHHRDDERIWFASPCSGHGFKHSTGLAESLVEQALTGSSSRPLAPFARQDA